CLQYSNSPFTF
nr:immunoglobulin light chain junction region [Macaca mulatta]MPN91214.1 immunoglobulin light chain junction region [Macaca mulatta]MPN91380.1 immunoglobulin light chain junction region [Macaca mulatta]MPN91478.1 immunoglobulin light chain junction region [Macaca mulatta]MPN91625.1 immunoglobulin light chain junction region [Macaca mulatta]